MFAEDDDELFEGTTPPPRTPAESFTRGARQPEPTEQTVSDFDRRPQQHPETTLEMVKPSRQRVPFRQMTPISPPPTESVPFTTKPPGMDAAAETTTVPITNATTEAPDPDAEVCSGRSFDSFMQLKNGSIYAFRGE